MNRLETRQLEYFVAVAEELHFGRAAERLSIAQPALSRTIRRLETDLGVSLLSRSTRHVALTASGEALLRHGRHALRAVCAAAEFTRQAGDPEACLRLVTLPGGDPRLLSEILAAYAERPDARRVDVLFGGNFDRADYLRDGRADVALLHAPFYDLTGLAHMTLMVEGRVAVLPRDHSLASRRELRLAELSDETFLRWSGAPEPASDAPEAADVGQMNQLIALGIAITVLPRSLAVPIGPGLVSVPVADAEPSQLVVAWSEHHRSPLAPLFVEAAVDAVGPQGGHGVEG
jgi:DNA-binding transcriptional LysR family regulator